MENPEEILHSLEEFAKLRPKDIPRELEEYLCFVAKTGDPVYQWSAVKNLFREKLISVITEFYESCPSVEIPPCPNVEMFNYDSMKNFILEKLDTFAAAPFTVQRICELLTTPRKEYNRIDKYMRALEKNILVVSTTEPGNRRSVENGEGIMNGIESEHVTEGNSNSDINVEEMDDTPTWPRVNPTETNAYQNSENNITIETQTSPPRESTPDTFASVPRPSEEAGISSVVESVITSRTTDQPYVSIEPVPLESCTCPDEVVDNVSVTITAIPAPVQKRRDSIEPAVTTDETTCDTEVIKKEEDKADDLKEVKAQQTDTETQDDIVKKADIFEQRDSHLPAKSQVIKDNITDEIESTDGASKENIAADFNSSNVNKENKPDSDIPVADDQVSELLIHNSGDETSSEVAGNKNIESVNSQEIKKVVFTVSINVDKSAIADVPSTTVMTQESEIGEEKSADVSVADSTNEGSSTDSSKGKSEERKEDPICCNDLSGDTTLESQSVEHVLNIPEEAVEVSSSEDGKVIKEEEKEEETPMEIDLEEDITTTATTAPKVNHDTI